MADTNNSSIRKITPAGVTTTLLGGSAGFVDGAAGTAQLQAPLGVAVDSAGTVYVADTNNEAIRRFGF